MSFACCDRRNLQQEKFHLIQKNINCLLSFDICVETQQELNSTRSWIQAQQSGYLFMFTNVLLSCFLVIFTVICLIVVWRNDWHTRSWGWTVGCWQQLLQQHHTSLLQNSKVCNCRVVHTFLLQNSRYTIIHHLNSWVGNCRGIHTYYQKLPRYVAWYRN